MAKYITIEDWASKNGLSRGYAYDLVRKKLVSGVKRNGERLMIREDAVRKNAKNPKGSLAGKVVGNITILEKTERKSGTQYYYKCLCGVCGKEFEANGSAVMRGDITSCGCLHNERLKNALDSDRIDGTRVSMLTQKIRSDNTSGHKGVSKSGNAWVSYIDFKGKRYNLGRYSKIEDAIAARERGEMELFHPFLDAISKTEEDADFAEMDGAQDHKGVYWSNGWRVIVCRGSKYYYIGRRKTMLEAKKLYDEVSALKTAEGIKAYIKRGKKKAMATEKKKEEDEALKKRTPKNYCYVKSLGYYRVYKKINGKYVSVYAKTEEEAKRIGAAFAECETIEQVLKVKSEYKDEMQSRAPQKNLVGQRFGKLTVIEPTEKRFHRSVVWRCLCDCGNECEVPQIYLNSPTCRKDCGRCGESTESTTPNYSVRESRDITGRVFGELTAVRPTNQRYNGSVVWECKCSCGKVVRVPSMVLKSGDKQSCGHKRYEDLRGKRFNRLVAVAPVKRVECKIGTKVWICRCDCGNVRAVHANSLKKGDLKSCGCARIYKNGRCIAVCPSCGEKFEFQITDGKTPQFCPSCAPKYADETWRVCPICRKLFKSMESGSDIACSKECLKEWLEQVKNSY